MAWYGRDDTWQGLAEVRLESLGLVWDGLVRGWRIAEVCFHRGLVRGFDGSERFYCPLCLVKRETLVDFAPMEY